MDEAAVWNSLRDELEDEVKEEMSTRFGWTRSATGTCSWTERIGTGIQSKRDGGSTSCGFGTPRFLWRTPVPASSLFIPCVTSISSTFGSPTPSCTGLAKVSGKSQVGSYGSPISGPRATSSPTPGPGWSGIFNLGRRRLRGGVSKDLS